jgi:hypothetical protein
MSPSPSILGPKFIENTPFWDAQPPTSKKEGKEKVLQTRTPFPGSTFGSHFGHFCHPGRHLGASSEHFGRDQRRIKNKTPKTSENDAPERAEVAQKALFWRLFGTKQPTEIEKSIFA